MNLVGLLKCCDVIGRFCCPPDEGELLDSMPLVMKTAIAVDINLTTFQKIDLFKVRFLNVAI